MQNELTALRPQLLETSDETERLMIKIEQDTIQVEAKKEIVACDEALGKMHALKIYDQFAQNTSYFWGSYTSLQFHNV